MAGVPVPELLLGVDPGRSKCGLGVIGHTSREPLLRKIVPRAELAESVRDVCREFSIAVIALGSGTEAGAAEFELTGIGPPIVVVDEYGTSLEARSRYYEAKPPRGWKRFIPRGLLVPAEPIDDWAAILIAERYVRSLQPVS